MYSHRYIKNTSTSGMIHTEHLLNAVRSLTSERARKPLCNQVGQKKKERKKKKKGIRMGPVPQGGSCEGGKVLHPGKSPHQRGDQPGWRGSLGGEHSNRFVEGKMESDLHRWSVSPPCTPQPKTLVCQCGQGLGAEAWALEVRLRERTGVGCIETA